MRKMILLMLMVCIASVGLAQEQPLAGVIDIRVHSAPDSTPRSIDAIDLARLAKAQGMRGLVLKNHYEPTASLAYIDNRGDADDSSGWRRSTRRIRCGFRRRIGRL
jgi:hypothetical protein